MEEERYTVETERYVQIRRQAVTETEFFIWSVVITSTNSSDFDRKRRCKKQRKLEEQK